MTNNPFDIQTLDPKSLRLFRLNPEDGILRMTREGDCSWREVRIARAFPFSKTDLYIGLRDGDDNDIGMLKDLRGMDAESRRLIEQELDRRYFTPKVLRVNTVKEEYGTVTWEVETDRGMRRFVVRNLRDNAYPLGPQRVLMTDGDGNRYEFPDITALGARAYNVLAKVM